MTEAKKANGLAAILLPVASLILPNLAEAEIVQQKQDSASEKTAEVPDLAYYEFTSEEGKNISMLYMREFDDDAKKFNLSPNPQSAEIKPGWFFSLDGINYYFSKAEFQEEHNKQWTSGEIRTRKVFGPITVKEVPSTAYRIPETTIRRGLRDTPGVQYPGLSAKEKEERLAELARQAPTSQSNLEAKTSVAELGSETIGERPASTPTAQPAPAPVAEPTQSASKETEKFAEPRPAPVQPKESEKILIPEKILISVTPEAPYSVAGMSILKGIETLFPRTWEAYGRNDAELQRELRKQFEDLNRYRGKTDTFADDDFDNSVATLSEIEKSLKARTPKAPLYKGKATAEEIKETLGRLKTENSQYANLAEQTRNSLRQFNETTAKAELLSSTEANQEIEATRKNFSDRIGKLDKLWTMTGELTNYIQKVSETEGFAKPETLVFDPNENPEAIGEFLYKAKKQAQEEFREKDEVNLYNSWFNEFFKPRVSAIRDIFRGVRNQYIDAEKLKEIMKNSQIGNGTANAISKERSELESAIVTLSNLIDDKEPIRLSLPSASRTARERKERVTLAERVGDIPYGGVVGLSYSTGFPGLKSSTSDFLKNPLTSSPQFDTEFNLAKAITKGLIGYRVGPFALVAEVGYDFRKNPVSSNQDLGNGLTFIGSENDIFRIPFGINAEIHGKHVFAGLGYGGTVSLRQNTEGVRFNGIPIEGKPDKVSTLPPHYEHTARVYAGVELGQKTKANLALQYDLREGLGLRTSVFVPRNR